MKRKFHTIALRLGIIVTICCIWGCHKELTNINPPAPTDSIAVLKPDTSLYKVSGTGGVDSGQILEAFNTNTNGVLAILDKNGNVIKEVTTTLQVQNFQKWNIGGVTYYTYFQTQGTYTLDGVAVQEGYDYICDSNLNQLNKVKLLPYENVDTSGDDKLDVHEFILLGPNHYMAISNMVESPTNIPDSLHPSPNARVIACIIQEVNNGQVVFQWDGTAFPEFYGSSVENNNFSDSVDVMDYMHMNSLCIDPSDNNIICSFRNLNEIIKINRTTGAIMWRLGGNNSDFPLLSDETFLRQHYARFTDNNQTLMFIDNGQIDIRPYSRILEFQLDQNAKTVTGFTAYNVPDNFIQYAGSVKKANGYYFIGGGSANYTLQVNYTTGQVYLRLAQNCSSYRALKY